MPAAELILSKLATNMAICIQMALIRLTLIRANYSARKVAPDTIEQYTSPYNCLGEGLIDSAA